MTARRKCMRCLRPIPDFATIWWHCVCGYQNDLPAPTFWEVVRDNAGAILLVSLFIGLILRGLAIQGVSIPWFISAIPSIGIVLAVIGYVRRGGLRQRD